MAPPTPSYPRSLVTRHVSTAAAAFLPRRYAELLAVGDGHLARVERLALVPGVEEALQVGVVLVLAQAAGAVGLELGAAGRVGAPLPVNELTHGLSCITSHGSSAEKSAAAGRRGGSPAPRPWRATRPGTQTASFFRRSLSVSE